MEIIDLSKGSTACEAPKRHHELLPDPLFAALLGPTSCGKTNLAVNLAIRYTGWAKLIVCCPTDDQAVYNLIREFNDLIVEKHLEAAETDEELEAISCENGPVTFIHSVDDIMSPDELDGSTPTLLQMILCSRSKKIFLVYSVGDGIKIAM